MHQTGRVKSIKGGIATVRFERTPACKNCGACIYIGETEAEVEIKNTLDAKAGDIVSVELTARSFLEANLIAYILPLCLLIAGLALGTLISELWGVVLGLIGAGAAFLLLRALEPRFRKSNRFTPRMIRTEAFGDTDYTDTLGGKENG